MCTVECVDPIIQDCVFVNNSALLGGAISNLWMTMTVSDCIFYGNTAAKNGGAVYNLVASPKLDSPWLLGLTDRTAEPSPLEDGFSHFTITNCTFADNHAEGNGGAICDDYGNSTSVNTLFVGNSAGNRGGAIDHTPYTGWDGDILINCTLVGNTANQCGGLVCDYEARKTISNSIIWGNTYPPILDLGAAVTTVRYTDLQWGWSGPGEHNISADPLFVDPDSGDYRLSSESPCIDAADNSAVPPDEWDLDNDGDMEEPIPFDLAGNPRFVDDPDTEDTGLGDPPIVDMGAYELQAPECPADINGDETVDVLDLIAVLAAWGPCEPDCPEDIDVDGVVDVLDLLEVLAAWGPCE